MPSSITPSSLAGTGRTFERWADAAMVDPFLASVRPPAIEEQTEKLLRPQLPKALQADLISVKDSSNETPRMKELAEGLLLSFQGQFTSDVDEYNLRDGWRGLLDLQKNLCFVVSKEPRVNEATSRCIVDGLLTQIVREVAERQEADTIRYDHEVMTSMSKTYSINAPVGISPNMISDGQASYMLPEQTRRAIKKFANDHNVLEEVTSSSDRAAHVYRIFLCMLAIEFKANNEEVAYRQILMDFAALLRHQRLLGFTQEYLMGITGFRATHGDAYSLRFFLGTLDDQGYVRHWDIGALNILNLADLLRAYFWISSNITQFVVNAADWHFDDTTPRDLEKLVWRARHTSKQCSHKHHHSTGGGDNDMSMDEMIASDSEAESEWMENDYGRKTHQNGRPHNVPYYTASELIGASTKDKEREKAAFEARERIRVQQGEMPPDFVMRRYMDSISRDGGTSFSVDDV
ncbi:uncharacterized protein EV420DRAFT_1148977 [Desarmillaria tabescens]|uniref:Uncharacterized protein n=1 Tax=Armillaria tabescens TaxID=1929756 RepID=A0AA39NCA1_ARMTA|nr:uncharacterized protein EV420DRAFT_1148977 [Desarmillaria tabescens]KAK0462997.1 hypothetical protein EV420DRAFT_1148977 [Desarmillaria tabescens]